MKVNNNTECTEYLFFVLHTNRENGIKLFKYSPQLEQCVILLTLIEEKRMNTKNVITEQ